jgi:hypothetical protein
MQNDNLDNPRDDCLCRCTTTKIREMVVAFEESHLAESKETVGWEGSEIECAWIAQ